MIFKVNFFVKKEVLILLILILLFCEGRGIMTRFKCIQGMSAFSEDIDSVKVSS